MSVAPEKPDDSIKHVIVLMLKNRRVDQMLGDFKPNTPSLSASIGRIYFDVAPSGPQPADASGRLCVAALRPYAM